MKNNSTIVIMSLEYNLGNGDMENQLFSSSWVKQGFSDSTCILMLWMRSANMSAHGLYSLVSRSRPAFRHLQYGKAGEGLVSFLT